MANVLVEETSLENIADAIRLKNGQTTKYKPAQMADAISAISGGGITPTGTKQINITQNGTTTENVTNYASAEITANVPNSYSASDEGKVVSNGALVSQTSRNVTANGTYDTTVNDEVVVNVPASGITPTGTLPINSDGTYDVTNYASVEVNTLMEKVTVSGTAVTQTIDPNKFYVFGEVTSLAITLGTEVSGYVNEYHFRFASGSTATTLSLPQTVTMPSDFAVEANKTYEISIVDGFGTVTSW